MSIGPEQKQTSLLEEKHQFKLKLFLQINCPATMKDILAGKKIRRNDCHSAEKTTNT